MSTIDDSKRPDNAHLRSILQRVLVREVLPEVCARAPKTRLPAKSARKALDHHTASGGFAHKSQPILHRVLSQCEEVMGRGESARRHTEDTHFWQSESDV